MRVLRAIAKDGRTFRSINGNGRYHVTGKAAPKPAVKNDTPYSAALSTRLTDDWPITILSADAATRWSLRQLRGRARDLERNGGIHSAYLDALEIDIIGAKGIGVQMKIKTGDEFSFENAKPVKGRVVTDPAEQGFLRVLKAKADSFIGATGPSKKRAYLRDQSEPWRQVLVPAVRAINAGQPLYEEQDQVMTVDGELDRYANFVVEKELRDFSKRGNCDVTGKHSLMDFCRLALRTCARDGDAVILVYLGYPNKWGVAFQLIEGDYMDDYYNVEILPNGNRIRMGVELNPFGRKVAVWVFAHHPGDYGVTGVNSYDPRRRRIAMLGEPPDPYFTDGRPEAVQAIHVSRSKRAEETRGVPWITAAMELIHHIEQYKQAEITAARAQACKHKVYERDAMSPDGEPIAWPDFNGRQSEELEPEISEQLEPGVRVKLIDPTHPSPYFPDFMKSMKREVSMALNYCYNILFGDLESVNYSSLRGGLQNQREGSKMGQQWFIDDVFDLMLRVFLKMSLLSGALPFRVSEFERLYQPEYKGRRWQWVDPKNDAETAVLLIEKRLATRSEMISDRTGGDFEETVDELDYEEGYIASKPNLLAAEERKSALENPPAPAQGSAPTSQMQTPSKSNPNHDPNTGEFSSSGGGNAAAEAFGEFVDLDGHKTSVSSDLRTVTVGFDGEKPASKPLGTSISPLTKPFEDALAKKGKNPADCALMRGNASDYRDTAAVSVVRKKAVPLLESAMAKRKEGVPAWKKTGHGFTAQFTQEGVSESGGRLIGEVMVAKRAEGEWVAGARALGPRALAKGYFADKATSETFADRASAEAAAKQFASAIGTESHALNEHLDSEARYGQRKIEGKLGQFKWSS